MCVIILQSSMSVIRSGSSLVLRSNQKARRFPGISGSNFEMISAFFQMIHTSQPFFFSGVGTDFFFKYPDFRKDISLLSPSNFIL